ncbi:MAG: hypothetical protein ABIJ48_03635 [Actinomycetota bacterium]
MAKGAYSPPPRLCRAGGSTATTAATATTVSAETTTTTVTPAEPAARQVLQRWNGARPMGSFEVMACNLGQSPSVGPEAVIAADGVETRAALPEVPPRGCVDAFDPESPFATFGVGPGQTVTARAAVLRDGVEAYALEQSVTVSLLSPELAPEALEAYDWWMESNTPELGTCVPLVSVAFADPHEGMKQHDRYTVVTPATGEPLAAPVLADMAICVPKLETSLGILLPAPAAPLVRRLPSRRAVPAALLGAGLGGSLLRGPRNHPCDGGRRAGTAGLARRGLDDLHAPPGSGQLVRRRAHLPLRRIGVLRHQRVHRRGNLRVLRGPRARPAAGGQYGTCCATGACFWTYFESTYGHEAFRRVRDALEATREAPGDPWVGCPTCLDRGTPVIDEGISALTRERAGFGPEPSVCKIEG